MVLGMSRESPLVHSWSLSKVGQTPNIETAT